jgi:hypothetical protein
MQRDTLNKLEAAVKLGTIFTILPGQQGQVIKIDKDGTLSITLKYAVSTANLVQYNPGPGSVAIKPTIGDSGIFNDQTDLHFDQAPVLPTTFTLNYDDGNLRIWLEADQALYNLTSNADKGRQGIAKSRKIGKKV